VKIPDNSFHAISLQLTKFQSEVVCYVYSTAIFSNVAAQKRSTQ